MTVTNYQPGAAAGLDAYIDENRATTSYGTATTLGLTWPSGREKAIIMEFDLGAGGAGIPVADTIDACSIELAVVNENLSAAISAAFYRVKRAWTESCTWNTYDGSNNWGTAGCYSATTDFDALVLDAVSIPASGSPHTFDITTLAQDARAGRGDILKFVFRFDANSSKFINYASSDNLITATPKLIITHTAPNAVTGTPAAQSAESTGSLSAGRAVTGTPESQASTSTGSLSAGRAVAGTPASQAATSTGSLSAGRAVAGTPAAQAASTAGSLGAGRAVSGTPAAQSATTTGALSAGRAVSGTPAAQAATTTGALSAGRAVSGTPAAQAATTTGALSAGRVISGTPASQPATTTGALSAGRVISGTPQAQSATTTGSLSKLETAITGTPAAQPATVTGALSAGRVISGTPAAQAATVTGSLVSTAPVATGGGGGEFIPFRKPRRVDADEEIAIAVALLAETL